MDESKDDKNLNKNSKIDSEICKHLNLEVIETGQKQCKDCGNKMPGRLPGGKNAATIEKEEARRLFEQRILQNIQELLNAQMNIARGSICIYKIHRDKDSKTKEHILVTDPFEIKTFLDTLQGENGTLEDGGDYYYITTKIPDNRALDSLIDRVFGKAPQKFEGSLTIEPITGMKIIKESLES